MAVFPEADMWSLFFFCVYSHFETRRLRIQSLTAFQVAKQSGITFLKFFFAVADLKTFRSAGRGRCRFEKRDKARCPPSAPFHAVSPAPQRNCTGLLRGQPPFAAPVAASLVRSPKQGPPLCPGRTILRTRRLAPAQWNQCWLGGHTDCRLFTAITFGSFPLIAESWPERFMNRRIKRERRGWSRGHGARWSLGGRAAPSCLCSEPEAGMSRQKQGGIPAASAPPLPAVA